MIKSKTLRVKGWAEWQSYRSDRGTPPWIKVHRNLLSNHKWASLSDSEKGQLLSIWVIAADKGGEIPSDAKILQRVCGLDAAPDLFKFIEIGLLEEVENNNQNNTLPVWRQDDVNLASSCQPNDAPETETETETEREGELKKEILTPPSKPKPPKPAIACPDWLDEGLWIEFKAMRQRIRAPMTPKAEALTIRDLQKLKADGFNPNHALERSIANSWRGVFPPKKQENKTKGVAAI